MKLKIAHVGIFVISMIHDVLIGGRTCIVLCLVSILVTICVNLFVSGQKKNAVRYIIVVLAILGFIAVAYNSNWFSIRDMFESSYMFKRKLERRADGIERPFILAICLHILLVEII